MRIYRVLEICGSNASEISEAIAVLFLAVFNRAVMSRARVKQALCRSGGSGFMGVGSLLIALTKVSLP